MKHNILYFTQYLLLNDTDDNIRIQLQTVMNEIQKVYSYVIHVNQTHFVVRYALSEYEKYNTYNKNEVIGCILDDIEKYRERGGKYIIGFRQPNIDILVEVYEPLVQKLAKQQHDLWRMLEYEDLCQMCRMTLVVLYNKNYFIHKKLLQKSFNNHVLQDIRRNISDFEIISLDTKCDGDDMDKLSLRDTIRDVQEEFLEMDKKADETSKDIFDEVKDIIVDIIGERQFEQLYRDYRNGHTTTWSRRKMQTLKVIFQREELTRGKFNNKYGGF